MQMRISLQAFNRTAFILPMLIPFFKLNEHGPLVFDFLIPGHLSYRIMVMMTVMIMVIIMNEL